MRILTKSDPALFFGEALDDALVVEHVEASAPLRAYLVEVLVDFAARPGGEGAAPITLALGEAMAAPPRARFERLRAVGDRSLTEAGLFSEHLARRGVDVSYVESLGRRAYAAASLLVVRGRDALDVLGELAREFDRVARALREVGNQLFAGAPSDERGLVRTYERWQKTGSPALARSLALHGLCPSRGAVGLH